MPDTLTPDAIRAMPAGVELDRLVAEAIGWEPFVMSDFNGDPWPEPMPTFSRSWGDAMYAAERFRLLKARYLTGPLLTSEWSVWKSTDYGPEVAEGSTGPLAISRAIALLALEGEK